MELTTLIDNSLNRFDLAQSQAKLTAREIGESLCCVVGNLMLEDMEFGKRMGDVLSPFFEELQRLSGIQGIQLHQRENPDGR